MKRYFSLFLVALLLSGCFSFVLINPAYGAEVDSTEDPSTSDTGSTGIYGSVYQLLQDAFYGDTEISGHQDLVLTSLSTFAIIFVFMLPFLLVFLVLMLFARGG